MSDAPFLLHHALVTAPDAAPTRWMFALHGILGSGTNLRSLAKRIAAAFPEWGLILPDLRMHGLSQDAPPPHTLAAAADDLVRLGAHLGLPIDGVLGHSFGGKVALAYLDRRGERLDQAWILDASPSARPRGERAGATAQIVAMLRAMPQPLPSRESFLAIVAEHGHAKGIAEWLAMNLRRADDGFRLRLDLDAIGALLDDYFAVDLWRVLEEGRLARQLHMVVGGASDALDPADRARLAALGSRARTHVLAGAGHWVHVDAPDALFAALAGALAPSRDAR
ncbi:MAG: alpha/beta fold hydrolase [Byssovorax sp.]